MNWLHRCIERRKARKLMPWNACVWSPQKAADKRFGQMIFEHRMALFRIQADAALAEWREWFDSVKVKR